MKGPLYNQTIVYDGDSICEYKGGYAPLIAEAVGGNYINMAGGGATLSSRPNDSVKHSVVENLTNLPKDGDLYCFEGGYNDYYWNIPIGTVNMADYTGALDTNTVCGALEQIFRYSLENFAGKPVCFVVVHKFKNAAYEPNSIGKTFNDYRLAMIQVCEKYSIPYYDAFAKSGLNGWNDSQKYFTMGSDGTMDGVHPTAEGYKRYYVPQLIALFESMMPR